MSDLTLGMCHPDSPRGIRRLAIDAEIQTAVEANDVGAVFSAYRAAVVDREEMERMLTKSLMTLSDGRAPEMSGVDAIRDVALAAIALAERVALECRKP